jgi:indolepyruvate ferredoxin oxidoreductase beta subunit
METMRILITGVGGQGNLLASRLLGEAAMAEDIPVRVSEVHGMAQRGGVVESTVMLGGLESPIISQGQADVLLGFEPLETLRALGRCRSSSMVITNINPIVPFTVELGQAQYPDLDQWLAFMKENFDGFVAVDADALAREAGTPKAVNVVMLGALIGTGRLPISRTVMEETIKRVVKPKFVEPNLKAFGLGFDASSQ